MWGFAASWAYAMVVVVVQFDGSLRPSMRSIGGLASCGAAILTKTHEEGCSASEGGWAVRAVGAKALSQDTGVPITSADAEYEGLILGLEWLASMMTTTDDFTDVEAITIRGDCKTVVDQLNQVSVPRKQLVLYQKALEHLDQIRCVLGESISFEHVPRDKNIFCDAICSIVMDVTQEHNFSHIQRIITQSKQTSKQKEMSSISTPALSEEVSFSFNTNRKGKEKMQVSTSYLSCALELLQQYERNGVPCLTNSMQFELWQELASEAKRVGDGAALVEIGKQFQSSARKWCNTVQPSTELTKDGSDVRNHQEHFYHFKTEGIRSEILGWHLLQRPREATKLMRKHSFLLSNYHRDESNYSHITKNNCMHLTPFPDNPSFDLLSREQWDLIFSSLQRLALEYLKAKECKISNDRQPSKFTIWIPFPTTVFSKDECLPRR
eukprot:scaffold23396_cov47-Attheya_sp.AAC.3